jgi:transposase-like protein
MKKRITTRKRKQEQTAVQEPTRLELLSRSDLLGFALEAGLMVYRAMIEEEIARLCGPRYRNNPERECYRWGGTESSLVMGGKKVLVERGRVRNRLTKTEVSLSTVEALQHSGLLDERQVEQMMLGVSTRKYRRSLEAIPSGMRTVSDSRSSVSRRFVLRTARQLQEWKSGPIREEFPILQIDGTVIRDTTVVIAMGINMRGNKRILGMNSGSTENYEVCKDLLAGLVARGLAPNAVRLAVLDGGKAIRKAFSDVFGEGKLVQRCQVHKIRNVMGYLSEEKRPFVKQAMHEAYASKDYSTAFRLLSNLAHSLGKENEPAAASVLEGLEETLTLHRIGIEGGLRKSLSSTNLIESMNSRIKAHCGRVKRWNSPNMIQRWVCSALIEAEKGFRAINGYKDMGRLIWLIDHRQNAEGKPLDKEESVA